MKTAANYLDAIREKYDLNSDRKAAALLGIKNAARLRTGEDSFSDTTAAKVAELLDTDPGEILIASHAERAKTERERTLWLMLAKKAGYAAGVVLVIGATAGAPAPAQAFQPRQPCNDWHYVNRRNRRRPGFRDDETTPAAQQFAEKPALRGFFFAPARRSRRLS